MGQLALQELGVNIAELKPDAPVGEGLVVISEFISSARVMRELLLSIPGDLMILLIVYKLPCACRKRRAKIDSGEACNSRLA